MMEIWKDVPGYLGYQASNLGRIKSLPRSIMRADGKSMRVNGCVMRPRKGSGGYLYITMHRKTVLVHRAVLMAFVGPPPDGFESAHNDGVRDNCNIVNLRWDTHSGNVNDKIAHGTVLAGERHGMSKLKEQSIEKIRGLGSSASLKDIAAEFSISASQAHKIITGKSWACSGGETRQTTPRQKITAMVAAQIRKEPETVLQRDLAKKYGIDRSQISRIRSGIAWK